MFGAHLQPANVGEGHGENDEVCEDIGGGKGDEEVHADAPLGCTGPVIPLYGGMGPADEDLAYHVDQRPDQDQDDGGVVVLSERGDETEDSTIECQEGQLRAAVRDLFHNTLDVVDLVSDLCRRQIVRDATRLAVDGVFDLQCIQRTHDERGDEDEPVIDADSAPTELDARPEPQCREYDA